MQYVFIGVIVAAMIAGIVFTARRNGAIKRNGIETDAVVSRVKKTETTDADTLNTTVHYTCYVTYRTQDGQTVEAKLASGKSFDSRIGKAGWDGDLHEGVSLRVKYLPEKPNYVIRV